MSDFLLQIGEHPQARRLIKTLGLPIPLPQKLRRASGPWEERPLADRTVAVGFAGPGRSGLEPVVAKTLVAAGASPLLTGADTGVFRELGEAYGRPAVPITLGALPAELKVDALVFDGSSIDTPADLRSIYDFFQPLITRLSACGRAVVLGRPAGKAPSPAAAAAQAALEGFVRSLARELGKRGTTAQLLVVHPGAEGRVEPVLRFVLSPRSAFVTGQRIDVDTSVRAQGEPLLVRPLERKVALVTGAARGIGEATARLMAAEGAHVVCVDRPADDGPVSQVARSIGGTVLLADVTDAATPDALVRHLRDHHGGVDVVVHNAGVTRDKTLARMKPELWDQALDINLASIVRIDDALLGGTGGTLRDGGRVVCLASVAGISGNFGQTNYSASKAGVIGYVRKRAEMLAKRGITVNAVAPGLIETRLTAAMPVMIREVGRRLSALSQGGLPRDVGEAVTFLASPGASGITGAVLRVCGGAFLGA